MKKIHSNHKTPCSSKLVVDVDVLHFVCLVKELHVLVEADSAHFLDGHLDVQVVAFFEKDGRVIYRDAVMNWVNSNIILIDLRFDIVTNIIIYWITHVLW